MKYGFDGTSVKKEWEAPAVYRSNPKKPRPDFWGCFARSALFAVTDTAARVVTSFIDQSCEGLAMECDGERFLLCNVTYVVSALDQKRSRHKKDMPDWIDEYVFHAHRLDYSLFKIPETAMSEILCVEGLVSPEDEFKATVENHGLRGLKFVRLWSGG
jgi:hypothetical protein